MGPRMPMLSLAELGGAASRVWETLSAGEDLPSRDDINLMAQPWTNRSAEACVDALFTQNSRRRFAEGAPSPLLSILAIFLFLAALAIVPWVWGRSVFAIWMLFIVPLLAG